MYKDLQQIKDEYANEQGRDSWNEFFSWNELTHTGIDRMQYHHDQIAIRYAQEQKRELMEMLEQAKEKLYGCQDPATSTTMLAREIEELIKSETEG